MLQTDWLFYFKINFKEPIFANEVEEMVKSRKELNAYLNKNKYHHAYSTNEDVKGTTGLEQSLSDFTDLDILDENNKFACRNCKCFHTHIHIHTYMYLHVVLIVKVANQK